MGSGVILRANPGCSIRIQAGVCLGLGVILHASEGNILVAAEAILGAGVLVIGWAEVGQRACIGSSVTLMNVSIAPGQMVAPGSLLGQWGRVSEPEPNPDRRDDRPHPVPGFFSLGQPSGSHNSSSHNSGSHDSGFQGRGFQGSNSQDSVQGVADVGVADQGVADRVAAQETEPIPSPVASAPETSAQAAEPERRSDSRFKPRPEPVSEPVARSVSEPAAKPTAQPISEPEPEPVAKPEPEPPPAPPKESPSQEPPPRPKPSVVYGKDHFLQMRFAMFPHHSEVSSP